MRPLALLSLLPLAACATTGPLPPADVIRYHLPGPTERGPATVEQGENGFASPAFKAAVARQLAANGYPAASGPSPFVAVVDLRQREVAGPPRRSSFSIGIGGGGFSGGRHGGVGVGGGVGIPVTGGGGSTLLQTELSVLIKRRADQTTVWEGHARGVFDPRRKGASEEADADRLTAALFTGFPGESGRTISVP